MNPINREVRNLITDILQTGNEISPRNLKVKEKQLVTLELDPWHPILDFSTRKMNFKYLLGELAWYLKRDRNTAFINQFSTFWQKIQNENGEIHSNYGYHLFGRQLEWVKDSLIKDVNTRQAIAFISSPAVQYEGNKDFICTMYLNFWIRDNKLYMKVQMRSNDIFYGTWYDAPFFSFLHQTMRFWLKDTYQDLQLGTYYHCADNIHFYEKHFKLANDILNESIYNNKKFVLKSPLFDINNGKMVLTDTGKSFLADVDDLNISELDQYTSEKILSKYFVI